MKNFYNVLFVIITSILYLVVIALWIAIPEELTLNLAVTGAALSFSAIVIFLNRQQLKSYYLSQHFKKLQDALVFFGLIFALLGLANYWAYKHPVQADLSVIKMNSLSDQSKNVLKNMDGEIKFKLFVRKSESLVWLSLLEYYRSESPLVNIEVIDIDLRPDLVSEYQIQNTSTLVIEYKEKTQYVTFRDELNVTNGLIKISRNSDPVVYYITGHEEGDINSDENEGYGMIYKTAQNSAVDMRSLNLLATSDIPFDAKAVVLWGPKKALQDSELKMLERYLDRKGNLLIALDPNLNSDPHVKLRELLTKYKILVRNDMVMDKKSFVNGSNGTIPLIDHYDHDHVITKDFKGQTFFPLVSSLEAIPDDVLGGLKGESHALIETNAFPMSWGEKSIKEVASGDAYYTKDVDYPGPMKLMVAFESDDNRVVAFGNSSFVMNVYSKYGSNYSLFINSLSWVVGEDRLVSFDLPIIQSEPIFISAPQLGIIFYFSVIFVPLILFAMAIITYRRRRNK